MSESRPDATDRLRSLWQLHLASTRSIGGSMNGADTAMFEQLVRRHREKHRRYHNVEHVAAVAMNVVELIRTEDVHDADAIVAAAMYHDAVYEPASPSNERASARLARRDLTVLGWASDRCERVAAMIEGTAGHRDPPDADTAVLFDADLAILGTEPTVYAEYISGVRAEYRHVDDERWQVGRREVLRGFLDRRAIFATKSALEQWEQSARANLADELAALEVQSA